MFRSAGNGVTTTRPPMTMALKSSAIAGLAGLLLKTRSPAPKQPGAAALTMSKSTCAKPATAACAVHHDDTLDRTTTGSGPLAAQTTPGAESTGCWQLKFDPFFAGEGLPALKDLLQLAETMDGKLYVEIKDGLTQFWWSKPCWRKGRVRMFFSGLSTRTL